jgi:hypothetical protein
MANATLWKNVAIAMQSAIASPKTITGITNANPGVVSSTAHGYTNGDTIYLDVQGMHQVNGRAVRVAGATTDSYQLEGVDTTLFDTFSTGTSAKVTMGTSITTATSINGSGGDFDFEDTTTIHANQRTQVPKLPNPATYTMDNIWDITDAGQAACKAASDAQALRVFSFTFGTGGKKMYFAGYVGASLMPGGQAQGLVTTSIVITMFGSPTYYAS